MVDTWAFGTDNAGPDGLLKTFMSMHHTHDAIRKHIPAPGDVLVTSQSKPILTLLGAPQPANPARPSRLGQPRTTPPRRGAEDSGPGVHDTTVAACSHELYEAILGIGPDDFHDSCTTNLHVALRALGLRLTDTPLDFYTPSPFNLWMNVPLRTTPAASFEDWWCDSAQMPRESALPSGQLPPPLGILPPSEPEGSVQSPLPAPRRVGPDPRQKAGDFVLFRAEMNCVVVMSACPSSDISPLNGPTGKSHDVHFRVFDPLQ